MKTIPRWTKEAVNLFLKVKDLHFLFRLHSSICFAQSLSKEVKNIPEAQTDGRTQWFGFLRERQNFGPFESLILRTLKFKGCNFQSLLGQRTLHSMFHWRRDSCSNDNFLKIWRQLFSSQIFYITFYAKPHPVRYKDRVLQIILLDSRPDGRCTLLSDSWAIW